MSSASRSVAWTSQLRQDSLRNLRALYLEGLCSKGPLYLEPNSSATIVSPTPHIEHFRTVDVSWPHIAGISLHDLTAIKKWMRLGTCIMAVEITSIDLAQPSLPRSPRNQEFVPLKNSEFVPDLIHLRLLRRSHGSSFILVLLSRLSPRSLPPHPRLQVWRRCNALLNGRQRRGGKETRIFATQWWLGRPWWRRWLGPQWVTIRFRCLREQIISVA